MLNIIIQIMALSSGLIANFLLPAVYGIQAYGEFIVFNAIVFVLHKTMSIISEPLIHFHKANQLFYSSLLLNALGFCLFLTIQWFFPLGSPWLLLGMLLSLSVVLTMQALALKKALIVFTSLVNILLLGSIFSSAQNLVSISIQQIMEISTLLPALAGLVFLARRVGVPSLKQLAAVFKHVAQRIPHLLTITAVMNLFTNGLPLLVMGSLSAAQIGLLRVAISVVQSATGIFPIASQAILAAFVRHKDDALLYATLSRFAAFYFGCLGCALIAASYLLPSTHPYLAMVCLLPIFYETILSERFMLTKGGSSRLLRINLAITIPAIAMLLISSSLPQVLMLYAAGFAFYALLLRFNSHTIPRPWWTCLPVIVCPLVVIAAMQRPWVGAAFLIVYMAIELMQGRLRLKDIRLLRTSL